jgi:hypothetical protein
LPEAQILLQDKEIVEDLVLGPQSTQLLTDLVAAAVDMEQ